MKVADRWYQCTECGNKRILKTNHTQNCWPSCTVCRTWHRVGRGAAEQEIGTPKQTIHQYIEDVT